MPSRSITLPLFAVKSRPVVTPSARSCSGHAVAVTKTALPKQAGPKPRFVVADTDEV